MSNDTERGEVHEGREQSPPVIAEQICEWAGWKGIVFLHFLERRRSPSTASLMNRPTMATTPPMMNGQRHPPSAKCSAPTELNDTRL